MAIRRMVRLNGRVEELRTRMSGRGWIAGGKMKPGRALLLLTGIVLLGGITIFNEMSPNAQASLLDDRTARASADLLPASTVSTDEVTGNTAGSPKHAPVAGQGTEENKGENDAAPRRVAAPAEPLFANPLWGLPLARLSTTRERPIFSASRRPPAPTPTYVAPVAVSQPAKPPEPERPAIALVGTIIGTDDGYRMAVFRDTSTQDVLRLRIGENYHGWVVRLISPREANLVKNGEQAMLELPALWAAPPPPPPRSRQQAERDAIWKVGAE